MKRIIIFFVIVFSSLSLFSQTYSVKNKKAISYFEEALRNYQAKSYYQSIYYAEKALKKDSKFVEVYYLLSDIYALQGRYQDKIDALKKAIGISPQRNAQAYILLAKAEIRLGKYKDAKAHLRLLKKLDTHNKFAGYTKKYDDICDFALQAIANPVNFKPINLGANINTKYSEYLPSVSVDEQTLIYTIALPRAGITEIKSQKDTQEDFYISKRDKNGIRMQSKNMGAPVNTIGNEGAQSISPDGRMLFFTSCNNKLGENLHGKSFGSCDIFVSYKEGNDWTKPINIGEPVNSYWWESQPSFSSDGKTLYFVSNRPGGEGGIDIWYAIKKENGTWGKVINAGKNINTAGDEQSPFIHPDNKTLYFSSDGLLGMGQTDLFVTRKDSLGKFQKPMNLGYPINTFNEEFSLILNSKGDKAYFSASYETGFGGMDLYEFEMPVNIRPNPVTYVKGVVYDVETDKKLSASFNIFDLLKGDTVTSSFSDKTTGEFLICIPSGNNFALNVSKEGYLFYSDNFVIPESKDSLQTYYLEIPLSPIKKGEKIILKNVFFDTDSYILKVESNVELDKTVIFLNKNSKIKIEIGGHTDNTGNEKHNKQLSKNRANAVYKYFISKGILAERLSFKGFASEHPIAKNTTKEGRSQNRRTEIKIIDLK